MSDAKDRADKARRELAGWMSGQAKARAPEINVAWEKLPPGFRRFLVKGAGVRIPEGVKLCDLSKAQKDKLAQAVVRLVKVTGDAGELIRWASYVSQRG